MQTWWLDAPSAMTSTCTLQRHDSEHVPVAKFRRFPELVFAICIMTEATAVIEYGRIGHIRLKVTHDVTARTWYGTLVDIHPLRFCTTLKALATLKNIRNRLDMLGSLRDALGLIQTAKATTLTGCICSRQMEVEVDTLKW